MKRGVILLLAVLSCSVTACSPSATGLSRPPLRSCSPGQCVLGAGAQDVQVFVEPRDGEAPVLRAIQGAQRGIELEVYLLTDTNVVRALEDAAQRGVDVRVILEPHPYGGGDVSAQVSLDALNAAGVRARQGSPAFTYTHVKMFLIDHATLYVMSANLSRSGLGGSSVQRNRDYGVIDTNPPEVAAAEAIFAADWERRPSQATTPNLVISPVDARAKLTALMRRAVTSLDIQSEELYDPEIVTALLAAAQRQVRVRLTLPSAADLDADALRRLRAGGVEVRFVPSPYMHAKLILVDRTRAFVGSENFSATSLDENREVGLLVADPAAVETLVQTFERDWAVSLER